MKKKVWLASSITGTARQGGNPTAPFEPERAKVSKRLREGPAEAAREEAMPTKTGPRPTRWTLRTIRAEFTQLHGYTLSGVWRWLRRHGITLRSAKTQNYSPDPDYKPKVRRLKRCLKEARSQQDVALLFLDETGYRVWPNPAPTWSDAPPAALPEADRGGSNHGQWRMIGAMNAVTGRVHFLDNYIVGRRQVIEMYRMLDHRYRQMKKVYVVQDNWSIHSHHDVLAAVTDLPRMKPVWLPTYAPWLNPIEKLWRWLKEDVVKMHRHASAWPELKKRVHGFMNQFGNGSRHLLRYCGLLGDGLLASPT